MISFDFTKFKEVRKIRISLKKGNASNICYQQNKT